MMYAMSACAVMLLIIIYLFFRSDALKKQLKERGFALNAASNKDKFLCDVIGLLSSEHEKDLIEKLVQIKNQKGETEDVKIVSALVNAFAAVVNEIALSDHTPKEAVQRTLGATSDITLEEFNNFLAGSDQRVKQAWSKNSVHGFVLMCDFIVEDMLKS